MRKLIKSLFFLCSALCHDNIIAQKKLIDSTGFFEKLYLADSNVLNPRFNTSRDSTISLLSPSDELNGFEIQKIRLLQPKAVLRKIGNEVAADSIFSTHLFRNLVMTSLKYRWAVLKLVPEKVPEDDEEEDLSDNPRKLPAYTADINIPIPFKLSNSIVLLAVPPLRLVMDTTAERTERNKMFLLKTGKIFFEKSCLLVKNNYLSFALRNAYFKDTFLLSLNDNSDYFRMNDWVAGKSLNRPTAIFENCVFDSSFVLYHHDTFQPSEDQFNPYIENFPTLTENKQRSPYSFSKLKFTKVIFQGKTIFQTKLLSRANFDRCEFNGFLFLNNKTIDSCQFNACIFKSGADWRNVKFTRGSSLKGSYFAKNYSMLISKDDPIESWGLDVVALGKIFFVIDWGWENKSSFVYWNASSHQFEREQFNTLSEEENSSLSDFQKFDEKDLEYVKLKFRQINDFLETNVKSDDLFGSSKQRVKNWFSYQVHQYEKAYYKQHGKLTYLWLCFLEQSVNFGHNGESRFFLTCFSIILLFAFTYRIFYSSQISAHILNQTGTGTFSPVTYPKRSFLRRMVRFFNLDLFKAFYFSFIIFFSPKFSSNYFKLPKNLTILIAIEWCLGVFFIVLFLVYIAGNYPIITKLLGV
jgi:hypothetical protein